MNFYCSPLEIAIDYNLKQHKTKNGWFLYLDDGWIVTDDFAYKGIDSSWCKLDFSNGFEVRTNQYRDFPIYYHDTCVTNFMAHTPLLPADGKVRWKDSKVEATYDKNFYPEWTSTQLDFNQASDLLFETLCSNVEKFAKFNNKPIFIPQQNGIDTITARSVFDYLKVEYETFDLPKTKPTLSPIGQKLCSKHWGFSQIQEIPNSIVVTGFHGDEWILRNPYYVHVLLSDRGDNIIDIFDDTEHCYMKKYFENYREKCSGKNDMTPDQIRTQICNDFQIWHLNSTYFYSPLKGRNLLDLLNADNETIIGQVTDAKLSKSVIEKCNSDLLVNLDGTKNQKDPEYFYHD